MLIFKRLLTLFHMTNCCLRLLRMVYLVICINGLQLFNARCNIYISRLCYDASVRLSVRLSVTKVHWRIIANLGFKFRSHFTAHCGRRAACSTAAVLLAVLLAGGSSRAMLGLLLMLLVMFHKGQFLDPRCFCYL